MAKKYDIIVHDEDPSIKPEKVSGVISESPQSLIGLYKMSGQNVEILREYEDEESRNYGKRSNTVIPKDFEFCNGGGMDSSTGFMKVDENLPQYRPTEASQNISGKPQVTQRPPVQYIKHEPTKFFDIGGIKCKMENGKMYQKQWMRLSESESQEFRIVSDTNNKICPIKGKHIEIMKWVLVEDDNNANEVETTKKVELLND